MVIAFFIFVPLVASFFVAVLGKAKGKFSNFLPKIVSLLVTVYILVASLIIYVLNFNTNLNLSFSLPWINVLGASFSLKLDGLSLPFIILTGLLGIASIASSWTSIKERLGFYYFNLLASFAGICGVFLASDLFLFVFMWELMLIPMFFIIDIWGHESRHRAAIKFFIFTQAGGLLMIAALAGLYILHGSSTGEWTFALDRLRDTELLPLSQTILMLGFFLGFAVKLPAFGLHPWLPDAHTQAPTAGSIILAGLLLKTGGYGLLRFAIPLFPQASREFAPIAMWIGVIGIVYGGFMALGQSDIKRLVAFSSVSHLGFVLLGIYNFNIDGYNGSIMQMISHGLSTGALFMIVGALQDRIHTRQLAEMGGLRHIVPKMGYFALFFTLALLGLPGTGNFLSEIFVLSGSFRVNKLLAIIAGLGLVFAIAYSLKMYQDAFQGEAREHKKIKELSVFELSCLATLMLILIFIGIFPQYILDFTKFLFPTIMQVGVL